MSAVVPGLAAKERQFAVVGVGASAGGLEALGDFLHHVPEESGIAFVVVQHLDPKRKGMLPHLLQSATTLTVVQAKHRTRVLPNHVYVIPPGKDIAIRRGLLWLSKPEQGLHLSVDFFFRSLAEDRENDAIGVVLTGMGSDGTLGLGAIRGKAGFTLAQDPAEAKFPGMPQSAIDAGAADVVAPVASLPGRILAYLRHAPVAGEPRLGEVDPGRSGLSQIIQLLFKQTGHDFSQYKTTTLYRRIERRIGIHQLSRIADYVGLLRENPSEVELLFKELLIGVTHFFRDPEVWQELKRLVIPALCERPLEEQIRVWVPACSTGEEAYSLGMLFAEAADELEGRRRHALQIFATDLDRDAIDRARAAAFPPNIAADVSPQRLARFFTERPDGYHLSGSIRERVIFAQHNVASDPPFTRLNLISCRNLLIYLNPELQRKLIRLFHHALEPGGFLLLGSAETVGPSTELFAPFGGSNRIYRRVPTGPLALPYEFPTSVGSPRIVAAPRAAASSADIQAVAEQLLLRWYAPAAVLVNREGDVLFIIGRTGKYLEPAAGKANWSLFSMAREGLRYELSEAFHRALDEDQPVIASGLRLDPAASSADQLLDLCVHPIREYESLKGLVLVVFRDVPSPAAPAPGDALDDPQAVPGARIVQLEHDLRLGRKATQRASDELVRLREEARATSEELLSANEELQSTNEELTTSKEEMQSMNEELQTLNHELQGRVDQLSRLINDMKNLLNSSEIATVFLDTELRFRLFTTASNRLFRLIATDVGRPITDIASTLEYPQLVADARQVLATLVPHEHAVAAYEDRWFRVRITPYRTVDNVIDGVVLTFLDISASRTTETNLLATQEDLRSKLASQGQELTRATAKALEAEPRELEPAEGSTLHPERGGGS